MISFEHLARTPTRLPVASITRDPGRKPYTGKHLAVRASGDLDSIPVVVTSNPGLGYRLVAGEDAYATAVASAMTELDAYPATDYPQRELDRYAIIEGYHCQVLDPVAIGRLLVRLAGYKDSGRMIDRAVSVGMSLTAVHHYESLVRLLAPPLLESVSTGSLPFRVARALADIELQARQIELADVITRTKLGSKHVDGLLIQARKLPRISVEELFITVTGDSVEAAQRKADGRPTRPPPTPTPVYFDDLERVGARLLGLLDRLRNTPLPEVERLRYQGLLRSVSERIRVAQESLTTKRYQ